MVLCLRAVLYTTVEASLSINIAYLTGSAYSDYLTVVQPASLGTDTMSAKSLVKLGAFVILVPSSVGAQTASRQGERQL